MIPFRDRNPTRGRPWLTWLIIAANVVAYLHERGAAVAGIDVVREWGFVPAHFLADPIGQLPTIVTSLFLHAGFLHLAGNMLFLMVFGDNVEDRLGRARYAIFYLAAGAIAVFAQLAIDPSSPVPLVGASGAIAGVLGAYLLTWPRARVSVLFPIFILFWVVDLPAWVVIGEWFVLQLLAGFTSLAAPAQGGVAFFAHIGGFLSGLVLMRALAPADRVRALPREIGVRFLDEGPRRSW